MDEWEKRFNDYLKQLKEAIAKAQPDLDPYTVSEIVFRKLTHYLDEELAIADDQGVAAGWLHDYCDDFDDDHVRP